MQCGHGCRAPLRIVQGVGIGRQSERCVPASCLFKSRFPDVGPYMGFKYMGYWKRTEKYPSCILFYLFMLK